MGSPPFDPFQVLFGPGGIASAADAHLVEQLLSGGIPSFPGAFPQQQPQPNEPRQSGPPKTSASALRNLPRIKVTAYDIAANESSECSICLDELEVGEPAIRLPCGHLFHEGCILDWLKKSNECPVCRFELPTDDPEYERERKVRMADRKLRMRYLDLTVKSAKELRSLAGYINVDVRDCLEKSELVAKIAGAPQVLIIPAEGMEASGSSSTPADSSAPGRPPVFTQGQLDAMSIGEVKALMERLGVDPSGCQGKADMESRLVASGRILVSQSRAAVPGAPEPPPAAEPPQRQDPNVVMTDAQDAAPAHGDLAAKSVGELRRLAKQLGVSLEGCIEKGDLVQRIEGSSARPP